MSLNIKTSDDRNIVAGNVDMASIYRLHDEIDGVSDDVTDLATDTATKLGGLRFGHDEQGNYGYYKVGADTLTPFNGELNAEMLMKYEWMWYNKYNAYGRNPSGIIRYADGRRGLISPSTTSASSEWFHYENSDVIKVKANKEGDFLWLDLGGNSEWKMAHFNAEDEINTADYVIGVFFALDSRIG